jgi:hypothetical protein
MLVTTTLLALQGATAFTAPRLKKASSPSLAKVSRGTSAERQTATAAISIPEAMEGSAPQADVLKARPESSTRSLPCLSTSHMAMGAMVLALAAASSTTSPSSSSLALVQSGAPFLFMTLPVYALCLNWGLPSTKIGSWKSMVSNMHRVGGIGTLLFPLLLAAFEAATGAAPPIALYLLTVAMAASNLSFGGALITRKVPGYDIPTLRAFAVGLSLGLAFLGHSLLFVCGQHAWYRPIGALFGGISVYAAIFAWSDALQHARLFMSSKIDHFVRGVIRGGSTMQPASETLRSEADLFKASPVVATRVRGGAMSASTSASPTKGLGTKRHWNLPFERASAGDVFFRNLWRQPTPAALEATVSPANGVVVFTTGMTALFATLALLQLRYLALGASGMAALQSAAPAFCQWSALQALLAVVANNFGTFAGTLVIQRRVSQRSAGIFNAIGLLIPVLNIAAFLLRHQPETAAAGGFVHLMTLPAVAAAAAPAVM